MLFIVLCVVFTSITEAGDRLRNEHLHWAMQATSFQGKSPGNEVAIQGAGFCYDGGGGGVQMLPFKP